jgi:cell division protein ZapA (FtsZ GTPase activity inhibitor)
VIRKEVQVLGQTLQVATEDPVLLDQAVQALERTFADMDRACRVHYGNAPATVDTRSWLLLGALNLAYRTARLEQEASKHTTDLEQRLSQLLQEVDDPSPSNPSLFEE